MPQRVSDTPILRHNWAGNLEFNASRYHTPKTIQSVQAIVRESDKVHVVGARHSFSDIADTTGNLISLARLPKDVTIDHIRKTVTVNVGMTYAELGPLVLKAGYALPNMASLPHVSIAGACASATHGSGEGLGNLATAVEGLTMVDANGELVTLNRETEWFQGSIVSFGGLGAVTEISLRLVPAFCMQQEIYQGLPLGELYANFDAIMGSAYSVCLFTNWQNGQVDKAYIKHKGDGKKSINPGASLFGASITSSNERGPDDYDRWISTPCGVVGPWHERLPHFELKNPTAKGLELQTEYFVPRERAVDALRAAESIHELLAPLIDVTEIRTIAADHLWMSPSYRQDTVGIHFGWRHKGPEVAALLPVLESHLEPFDARPHWGKLFATTPARLRALYERLPDFEELLSAFDPRGKFRNNFLDNRLLGV